MQSEWTWALPSTRTQPGDGSDRRNRVGPPPPSGSRARWLTCHLAEEAAGKVQLLHHLQGAGLPGTGAGGRDGRAALRTAPGRGPPASCSKQLQNDHPGSRCQSAQHGSPMAIKDNAVRSASLRPHPASCCLTQAGRARGCQPVASFSLARPRSHGPPLVTACGSLRARALQARRHKATRPAGGPLTATAQRGD